MAHNILAINPGHNGSAALISDGEVKYYVEEERLSRAKYDGNPFKAMIDIMSKWEVHELVICGTGQEDHRLPWTGEDSYTALVRKFYPEVKISKVGHEHHLTHAADAFYNSGFEKAVAIVIDGAGSKHTHKLGDEKNPITAEGYEVESIYICEYPSEFNPIFKSYGNNEGGRLTTGNFLFDDAVSITKAYEGVSHYLGFGFIEAGKTMGLAPYGKEDANIPPLFWGGRGSKNVFIPSYPAGSIIDQARNPSLAQSENPKEWHKDKTKLPEIAKNLAYAIQRDTQRLVLGLIEQVVEATGIKNVVIAGGYGLNCVTNYHLRKKLKKDINLYCEPIAHDGGTAIGAAKLFWHMSTKDTTIRPQTSLYLGPEYTKEQIQFGLEGKEGIEVKNATYEDVAKLISEKNIVSLFQGRSEAGPRALGNRSIIYDPRDPDGKDHVNVVKGREWFRPFAGTVLKEDASEWFDLAGMEETPHMMYAVDVVFDKVDKIPAVCHVDKTCRIQTVTQDQNEHYYNLIKAFKDITEVPVLFNTSFNLAGEPLVETIDDALNTLFNSKLKYLYLPELGVLVTKTRPDPEDKKPVEVLEKSDEDQSSEQVDNESSE